MSCIGGDTVTASYNKSLTKRCW